jgi:hypothetical protein
MLFQFVTAIGLRKLSPVKSDVLTWETDSFSRDKNTACRMRTPWTVLERGKTAFYRLVSLVWGRNSSSNNCFSSFKHPRTSQLYRCFPVFRIKCPGTSVENHAKTHKLIVRGPPQHAIGWEIFLILESLRESRRIEFVDLSD